MTDKELDTNANTIWEQHNIIDNKAAKNLDYMINDTLHKTQNKLWDLQNIIIKNTINTQVEQDNAIQEKTIETDNTINWANKDILLLKEQIENQHKTITKKSNIPQEHHQSYNEDVSYRYPTHTEINANRIKASENPQLLWQQSSLNNYSNPIVRALMTPVIRAAQWLWEKTLKN